MGFETSSVQNSEALERENKRKAFANLFEQTLSSNNGESAPVVEYNLPYPKEDFLRFLTEEKNVLLHGSSNRNIEILEPRQANDAIKISGNKKAIYGVTDPVLPIFYAIQDKKKLQGIIKSGASENAETGELEYEFKISKDALESKPWTRGVIYLFDKNQFSPERDDNGELSGEWVSEIPVRPVAKLEVGPEDFRFLDNVVGE